jgi:hypothetical protein
VSPNLWQLQRAANKLDADFGDREPDWVAREAVRHVRRASDLREALVEFLADYIRAERRAAVRREEQRQYRSSTHAERRWRREHLAEVDRLRVEEPEEYRKHHTIGGILDEFREKVRLELTAELLSSSFSLGDGRKVLWGRATVADHRQRVALLVGQAEGTLRTAALHEEAIALIEASGVECLSDVRAVAA